VAYRVIGLPRILKLDTLLMSVALGIGILIYGVAGLGFARLLTPHYIMSWVILCSALSVIGLTILYRQIKICEDSTGNIPRMTVFPLWGIGSFLLLFGLVYMLSTLAPPMNGDDLHSYLDVPRQYLDAQGIIPLPYEIHSHLPLNIQMLSATAMGIKGDELALMFANFSMAAGCALAIFMLGRRYLNYETGLLAALIFISTSVMTHLIPTAKVNLGFAFFDLLAIYAVCRWAYDSDRNIRWLIAGGILSGLAFGSQYCAGYTGIVLASIIGFLSRKDGISKCFSRIMAYGLPAMLLASPWLVKNYIYAGNPVYPVLNTSFGLPALELFSHEKTIVGMVTIFWDMSIGKIAHFGKAVGPMLFLILPFVILLRPIPKSVKFALGFFFAVFFMWYFGVQRPRNLLTGLGILSLVSAYTYIELGRRSRFVRNSLIILGSVVLLFNWAEFTHQYFVTRQYQRYILGLENREDFIQRMLDMMQRAYPSGSMTKFTNEQLADNTRILSINNGNGYYIRRPYIDSRMVDADFSHDKACDADTLLAQWRSAGITHVFVNENYVGALKEGDRSRGIDMFVLSDPAFRARCFKEIFSVRGQHLYALTCQE